MAPYMSWMDDPKKVVESVDWQPVGFFRSIYYMMWYRKRFKYQSVYYDLDMKDVSNIRNAIQDLYKAGLTFEVVSVSDKGYNNYIKFLAGSDVELSALALVK